MAHLHDMSNMQPLVIGLTWCLTAVNTQMSFVTLPLLSALTSVAFEPSNRSQLRIPRVATKTLFHLKSLRRLELHRCFGYEDPGFSVGRAVPSLRILIVDEGWWDLVFVDQELDNLERLTCPVNFWGELVLRSSSAGLASPSRLRELHLCQGMSTAPELDLATMSLSDSC